MTKEDLTKIMVYSKRRFPLSPNDVAIYVVDIQKSADEILTLINKEKKEEQRGLSFIGVFLLLIFTLLLKK